MAERLAKLNQMERGEAVTLLSHSCGSRRWVEAVAAGRPYASATELLAAAERACDGLSGEDWREAFAHHPRIGERNLSQGRFGPTAAQAGREQSGMSGATDTERAEFDRLNADYERRFGHVFLVCATGKSSAEMLASLRARLTNDAATEFANASREQRLITRLRLERMLQS